MTGKSFEELFRQYYPALVTYLAREFRLADVAEDLVQTIFTQLWAKRDKFNSAHLEHGVGPYLYGAARHAALNYLRDNKLRNSYDPRVFDHSATSGVTEDDLDNIPSAEQDPSVVVEHAQLEQAVQAAVEKLPPRAREIWALHRDHGLTYPEIATTLGISINTVKTQMTRSIAALRKVAAPYLAVLAPLVTLAQGIRSL